MGGREFDPTAFIIRMAVLILAITIHEFAHAFSADRLGDPTPRRQGRISLLPPDHLDPVGTIMMVLSSLTGFGIGWGKPVMVNPMNFRNPLRDHALVSVAGPVSNLLQASVFAVLLRSSGAITPDMRLYDVFLMTGHGASPVVSLLFMGVIINLSLAFFNLVPLAPLDGSWIMMAILPRDLSIRYTEWMMRYGQMVFLLLVLMAPGVLSSLISPPMWATARILLGLAG